MKITPASTSQIRYVAENMRDRDLAEFSALADFDTREGAADALAASYADYPGIECATLDDGTPVAIGGCTWPRDNVASMLFFATDDFRKIVIPLTRYTRNCVIRPVQRFAHRIDAFSMSSYTEMQQWVEIFGLRPEATLQNYGKRGEDFVVYAWVRSENGLEKQAKAQ